MATILIDYENVVGIDGLKGVDYLNEKDTLIIFFSESCKKIRAEYLKKIEQSRCSFKVYKLLKSGKNALDFYIAAECGILCSQGENQISIVSRDKGFEALADFFRIADGFSDLTIRIANTVELAIASMNDPENTKRRKLIEDNTQSLNLEVEQSRINERRAFIDKITKAFGGTKYENQTNEILNFIESQNVKTPRGLYTGSMHEFGREDGREIYQMLKKVV